MLPDALECALPVCAFVALFADGAGADLFAAGAAVLLAADNAGRCAEPFAGAACGAFSPAGVAAAV